MLAEFKCSDEKCPGFGEVFEEYFPTNAHYLRAEQEHKPVCRHCGKPAKKIFSVFGVSNGDVPGYEKANENHLTIGKAVDQSFNKWV